MKIFATEIADGLESIIRSNASISYASLAAPTSSNQIHNATYFKSLAAQNDEDLYYVQSILVSSSWNKNDDIFDRAETWKARSTPEDKPTNLNHDENLIIGHITANWPITEDGILIDEETPLENLPEKYHILTGSVIYKAFSSPELRDRSAKLIAEIENGQKYVSMECFFRGFDYGLINKETNEYKILSRNDATAYLSKHLRAYGGLGEHGNYKIGRVLRDITFTGKGFVDKPANPDSIIFTKDNFQRFVEEKNEKISIAGVSNFQSNLKAENITMNSDDPVTNETVETPADESTTPTQTTETTTDTSASLEAELAQVKAEFAALAQTMEEEKKKKEEKLMKMKAELEAANEVIAAYKTKEAEMMKKEKKMKRVAALVEAGIENETAEATADKFESLDDEAFAAMTSLVAAKKPPFMKKDEEMTEDKPEKKKASEAADTSILEAAEIEEEVNLGVGSDAEPAIETTRAALVEFVCSRLGKKLNKGE